MWYLQNLHVVDSASPKEGSVTGLPNEVPCGAATTTAELIFVEAERLLMEEAERVIADAMKASEGDNGVDSATMIAVNAYSTTVAIVQQMRKEYEGIRAERNIPPLTFDLLHELLSAENPAWRCQQWSEENPEVIGTSEE